MSTNFVLKYPDTEFQRALALMNACGSARAWVNGQTLEEAWATCPNPDWMRWILLETQMVNCTCTETSPREDCPISVIEMSSTDTLRRMFPVEDVAAAVIRHTQPMFIREQ